MDKREQGSSKQFAAPFPGGEHINPQGHYTPQLTPPFAKDEKTRTKLMPFRIDLLADSLMDNQEGPPLKHLDSSSSYIDSIVEIETRAFQATSMRCMNVSPLILLFYPTACSPTRRPQRLLQIVILATMPHSQLP